MLILVEEVSIICICLENALIHNSFKLRFMHIYDAGQAGEGDLLR